MTDKSHNGTSSIWSPGRIAVWGGAAVILLIPLIGMQFSDEVNWSSGDFVIAAILLSGIGITYELVVRYTRSTMYRAAVGVAVASAFLLVWVNGAVGIIGGENNEVNMLYFGVLAIGVVGALISRFEGKGLARTLSIMALAQSVLTVVAMIAGWGLPYNSALQILFINSFFIALWVISATLFQKTAQG